MPNSRVTELVFGGGDHYDLLLQRGSDVWLLQRLQLPLQAGKVEDLREHGHLHHSHSLPWTQYCIRCPDSHIRVLQSGLVSDILSIRLLQPSCWHVSSLPAPNAEKPAHMSLRIPGCLLPCQQQLVAGALSAHIPKPRQQQQAHK